MKIAWLHTHFINWMGGTKFIFEVIKSISKVSGVEIEVFVEKTSGFAKEQYIEIGVPIHITTDVSSSDFYYWPLLLKYIRKNRAILSDKIAKFDIAIASMFPMNAVIAKLPIRKVQYCFEPYSVFYDREMIKGLPLFHLKRWAAPFFSTLFKRLDIESTRTMEIVFTLNEVTRSTLKEIYEVDAIPTFAGIDLNVFKPTLSQTLMNEYEGKRILIHSTDFTPIKGTNLIIQALPMIVDEFNNALLLITSTVQNEKEKERLLKQARNLGIEQNIKFLGFLPYDQLPAYYSLAEVLLQAGVGVMAGATSMSLPVKEAMACGTPAIRHPVTNEDVEDNISGYLVDATDTKRYAEAVRKILKDRKKTELMGSSARETVVSKYSWDSVRDIILTNLEKLLL
jgi:glycosyltransferase involved in cell wall biosynthesis